MPSSTSFSYDDLIAALNDWLEESSEEFIDNQSTIVSMGESRLTTDLNFEIFDRVVTGSLITDQYEQAIKPSDWQGTRSLHLRDPDTSADSDFADVVLLLSMDGVDGATVAVDDSPLNNDVNFQGAIVLDTTIKKFGTAALDADTGDPLDFLEIPHNTAFPVLAGDFTIEMQINTFDQVGGHGLINHGDGGTGTTNWRVEHGNGSLLFDYATGGGGFNVFRTFGSLGPNSTFQHIAITRLGNDLFAHVDGVKSGATFDVTGVTIGGTGVIPINIGSRNEVDPTPNIGPADASIDEVRVTVGTARYTTANFTAPTQAFPTSASAGLRRYLERRTYEWCLDFEPDEAATAEPQYYAELTETEFFMVPPPDLAYGFELRQIQPPDALAPGNQNTWLGDNAGDLLLYACLLASDEFLISDPADMDTWRQSYSELMPARKIELRRQWRGDYDPVKSAATTVSMAG